MIKDEHSKRALGWAVADHTRADLVTDAVDMAARTRRDRMKGIIMHSDRGSQYTSTLMTKACGKDGLLRSWIGPGSAGTTTPLPRVCIDVQTRALPTPQLRTSR
ncbi:DDE-type integrase/transposase/recombinase [Williamsia muralis]|uniref:DDE-type integrase/transposase/recombinase n=1 Tax=Williamsia marianensis TaxID=85044 RepID=UPI003F178AEE